VLSVAPSALCPPIADRLGASPLAVLLDSDLQEYRLAHVGLLHPHGAVSINRLTVDLPGIGDFRSGLGLGGSHLGSLAELRSRVLCDLRAPLVDPNLWA